MRRARPWLFLATIAAAELIVAVSVWLGVILHAVLILALLGAFVRGQSAPDRRLLAVLLLLPLLRILSLAMPVPDVPEVFWLALAGTPLWVAILLAARMVGWPRTVVGLALRYPALQLVIGSTGVPLSLAAYSVIRPAPVHADLGGFALLAGVISLVLFGALTEEFIFRGLVLPVACEALGGRGAVVYSSLAFATLYASSLSPAYIGFIGLVGLYFGYCAYKTGSLWGVTLAHSLMTVGALMVWPAVTSR